MGNNPPPPNNNGSMNNSNNGSMNGSGNGMGNNPPPPNNNTNGSASGAQGQFVPISSSFTPSTWRSIDSNMTNAVIGNSIWRLNPSSNSFMQYYQSLTPYLMNPQIFTFQNIIVVTSFNQNAAQVFAYLDDNNGHLTAVLNYQFNNFVNTPKITVSPKLTKVLVIGPVAASSSNMSNTKAQVDAFHINYTSMSTLNISFPIQTVADPQATFLAIS